MDSQQPTSLVLSRLYSVNIQQAMLLTGWVESVLLKAGFMNSWSVKEGNCRAQSCLQAPDSGSPG